jgi:hypothetical protein
MRHSNRELWLALLAILAITVGYVAVVNNAQTVPAASGALGHGLGILGFVMMLMTETLYSLRKRARSARWGRMAAWLQFHIFTGLVGPYLVLLHTSWQFNGLAGVLTLFTIVIVASGFIGRYIYTAIPRTADGAEVAGEELERQIQATESELRQAVESQPELAAAFSSLTAAVPEGAAPGAGLVLERGLLDLRYRWQWRQARRALPAAARAQVARLERLQLQKRSLRRSLGSLALARHMLAVWQAVHMPIGMALFTLGFIHAAATLYFTYYLR